MTKPEMEFNPEQLDELIKAEMISLAKTYGVLISFITVGQGRTVQGLVGEVDPFRMIRMMEGNLNQMSVLKSVILEAITGPIPGGGNDVDFH